MNLRLQYLAGMWLDSDNADDILIGKEHGILNSFRFPDERFIGSPTHIEQLKEAMNELYRPVDVAPPGPEPAPVTAPATPAPAAPSATPAATAPAAP